MQHPRLDTSGELPLFVALKGEAMEERTQRRLAALANQVEPIDRAITSGVELQPTAAQSQESSVVLPEKLSEPGPWRVHRCKDTHLECTGQQATEKTHLGLSCRAAACAERLTTGFPSPGEHVKTLYDNLEYAIQNFSQV